MPVETIGTAARTYSTIQAWENGIPATPTGGYTGECYNDSEFAETVTISGHTTSAVNFIRLTAAALNSFQDNASKSTNPLFYDQTKGVGITADATMGFSVFLVQDSYVTIDRLQIKRTGAFYTSTQGLIDIENPASPTCVVKDCIVGKLYSGTAYIFRVRDATIINCLAYDSGATASNLAMSINESGTVLNCTIVRIGTAGGVGITRNFSTSLNTATNCAVFNWTTNFDSTTGWSGTTGYNGTDSATAPGSNAQVSLTFASQFESTTNDFRLKAAANLIGTGNTNATLAPSDIIGTVRGTGTAGDIGAWEFVSSGGGGTLIMGRSIWMTA
jgi:hypothetical protein